MSDTPLVVLVHGAFAESASWSGVIPLLRAEGVDSLAIANPLRSVPIDAQYLRDVVHALARPVILVGHSYGGMVLTEGADGIDDVVGLVYVAAFAPETGDSGGSLSAKFPGSTLGPTLVASPLAGGDNDLLVHIDLFHGQFAADVDDDEAYWLARTQRPITDTALGGGLQAATPVWKSVPSWFVFGSEDRNIPVAAHRFMAERAGSRKTREIEGASHLVGVSHPDAVAAAILDAVSAARSVPA